MASGTCISLIALVCRDKCVDIAMPWIKQNIQNADWRPREAAMLALGSIMEGPSSQRLAADVQQAIPLLLHIMQADQNEMVKDTTAWTLGRICGLHLPVLVAGGQEMMNKLMQVLVASLGDVPRVSNNVCYAFHNMAEAVDEVPTADPNTNMLTPYFRVVVEKLLATAMRKDWDENNLRNSAFEAVNQLVLNAAPAQLQLISELVPFFCQRLNESLNTQITTGELKTMHVVLQAQLCGSIQCVTNKLAEKIAPHADTIMQLLLQVFRSKDATAHEEAFMAIGAMANAIEGGFEKYMHAFHPFLQQGLNKHEEYQVCVVAAGVVGDVARSLEGKMLPFCDDIVTLLLRNLQNPRLNRAVKPPILAVFGDIALAIGGHFQKYLPVVMTMLQQAGQIRTPDTDDEDLNEYVEKLRAGILDAYTMIVQGLNGDGKAELLRPYINVMGRFLGTVATEGSDDDETAKAVCGVLGDMAQALGVLVKPIVQHEFAMGHDGIYEQCLKSEDPSIKQTGQWAKQLATSLR